LSKIIIGIHGLGNKPPPRILKDWWEKSLREGLKAIGHPGVFFTFDLVYWSDILHPTPLSPEEKDEKSPLFIEFPYEPATSFYRKQPGKFRRRVLDFLERNLDKIFLLDNMSGLFSSMTNIIIRRYFQDLDQYYSEKPVIDHQDGKPAKELIRKRLWHVLQKHRRKQILLIAHSMGSIIAYEVLWKNPNEVKLDTLVTIGSPLGQPFVKGKIAQELNGPNANMADLKTPSNITRKWYNLSDLEDKVAINYNLEDDYGRNEMGISPKDKIIFNNYIYDHKRNPHKSYGYLRSPEMAELIYEFLVRDRSRFGFWLSNRLSGLMKKFF
jgi:hypothetical protein